jgi:serine/threonine-protein kinase
MALGPGTLVGNNVRLVRVLGQGGMGSIWVADHLTLHTQVAVKFMSTEIAKNAEAATRFTREASAAAQIKSPHVVQTFDHGLTEEGIPFIVMELLEGEDLAHRIQRKGKLPPVEVALILGQVAKALYRAHSLGIVHRDIKPENIFLTDVDGDLLVKVLDFGIAKRAQDAAFSMTSTGAMVGTPYYMSPEQVMSAKSVDLRSDLWSLAVVAYHAVTGKVPFDAETVGALCVAINAAEFDLPTTAVAGLPPSMDAWFRRALARDPAKRFQTAKDFGRTLEQAAAGIQPNDQPGLNEPSMVDTNMGARPTGAPPYSGMAMSSATPSPAPMAGTLMEASVTTGTGRSSRGIVLVAGGVGLFLLALVSGFVVMKLRSHPEAEPAAATASEVPSVTATETATAPVPPAEPPPTASVTPKVETTASPATKKDEPLVGKSTKPADKPAEKPVEKPIEKTTKPEATARPSETSKPTKPPDKYGF